MSTRAFLGLGGNLGDPVAAMAAALQALDDQDGVEVVTVSSLYRTPPWGMTQQPDFCNAVAAVDTSLAPRPLLDLCLAVERSLKRKRTERWGPRLIDIDILLYGQCRIDEDGLHVPHPRMSERAFVLVPLAEIAPEATIDGGQINTSLERLDISAIKRLPGGRNWWRKSVDR